MTPNELKRQQGLLRLGGALSILYFAAGVAATQSTGSTDKMILMIVSTLVAAATTICVDLFS
jgi:hypothetical protein